MAKQPNLFPLKMLVISLGLLLVGGTIFLFASIATKAGKELGGAHCKDASISLPEEGDIVKVTAEGNRVLIMLTTADRTKLFTADRCTGKIVDTITVVLPPEQTEPPTPQPSVTQPEKKQ